MSLSFLRGKPFSYVFKLFLTVKVTTAFGAKKGKPLGRNIEEESSIYINKLYVLMTKAMPAYRLTLLLNKK